MLKLNRIIIFIFLVCGACNSNEKDWFFVNKIDDRTFIISEPKSSQGNSCFLIIGDQKAILFDSGSGEQRKQKISRITDSLTQLPVSLILSHFHFDHIGNIGEFDQIGIPAVEGLANRIQADSLLQLSEQEVLRGDRVLIKVSQLLHLDEQIDLGNREIMILHTPGHSSESVTIMDMDSKYIFAGDLVYNGLLLVNDCESYVNSVSRVMEKSEPDYRVFGSHGIPEVRYDKLSKVVEALEKYQEKGKSFDAVKQIDFYGTTVDVYTNGGISFIVGYLDAF